MPTTKRAVPVSNQPYQGGQAVRDTVTDLLGITTTSIGTRSGRIGVQFIGEPHDVLTEPERLALVTLTAS